MLKIASGQVIVAGFRRTSERPKDVEGCETIDLGETRDGEFLARIGSVASVALRLKRLQNIVRGCQVVLDEFGLPGYAINVGPKGCVMFTPQRVTNYRDFIGLDTELWTAFFFFLANRGILLPPGPDDQWTLSVQHGEEDVERYVDAFAEFCAAVSA